MGSYGEWLKRARSSLELAKSSDNELVYYEDLCFQVQQAVEKGLKGLLIYNGVEPEKTHNLSVLLQALEKYTEIDDEIKDVLKLQNFAVQTRYPGEYAQVEKEEYDQSVVIAEKCLKWIEEKIAFS
ncbi:MAG: HEPN domain-containing protein [Fibromonadaceae bacterium]|jgi:HEPN domain-containing protein|nr:HEPN domain-containing protein [Fibromonadaceae bacterium]